VSGTSLVLLGTGLYAEELIDVAAATPETEVVACCENIDRAKAGGELRGVPIVWIEEVASLGDVAAVCAITTTERERYVEQIAALGVPFGRLVHPAATLAPSVALGTGVVIQAGAIVGAHTTLGDHVMVNRGALIGHHVCIEDYVTIQPGANLGGATRIGARAYIALGAQVLDRCVVGEGALVGAAALVTRDVEAHAQVMGVPARVTRTGVTGRQQ
jgi:sugar O-acyltransferase (sialic acid O-acetyltransferase NeuD family)